MSDPRTTIVLLLCIEVVLLVIVYQLSQILEAVR